MLSLDDRIRGAASAGPEELWTHVRDPHPAVLEKAVMNANLTEAMAVFIAKRRTVSPETLGLLSTDVRFRDSYRLKAEVCRNPRTPQRTALSLLKHLRIFDLSDMSRDQQVGVVIRQKAEQIIGEKIPSLPTGVKIALSRRAGGSIVMTMLEKSTEERVVSACLDSPMLTEGQLLKIINRTTAGRRVISGIAEHPKWSLRYHIRYALIRNFHSSMVRVERFIGSMKTTDLKDLYNDPKLPAAARPFIFRELSARGATVERQEETTFYLTEEEDGQDSGF